MAFIAIINKVSHIKDNFRIILTSRLALVVSVSVVRTGLKLLFEDQINF